MSEANKSLGLIETFVRGNTTSKLSNYVLPGLESLLADKVRVRMFDSTREQQIAHISPHSHRFNFACIVLSGSVENIIWRHVLPQFGSDEGDLFASKVNKYKGAPGQYDTNLCASRKRYRPEKTRYEAGESYAMRHDEIHSIVFEDRAKVLFLEGPDVVDSNVLLVPVDEHGAIIHLDATEPWMFRKS